MYIFDEVVAVGFNTLYYDASVGVLNPRTNHISYQTYNDDKNQTVNTSHPYLTPLNNNAILKTDSIVGFYLNIKMGRKLC